MGAVSFSLDLNLVLSLKRQLTLDCFVETGTFKGDTVLLVRQHFNKIFTIEMSQSLFEEASERFKNDSQVQVLKGHSPAILRELVREIKDDSVLYWLDAHWCGAEGTESETLQCPLLGELEAISPLNERSVVLVDDARLFLCPPPPPCEASQWPDFSSVISKMRTLSQKHETLIVNDVIICYPVSVKEHVAEYASKNSVDWLAIAEKGRSYDTLLSQLEEKEAQIQLLANVAREREMAIKRLSSEIETRSREFNAFSSIARAVDEILQRFSLSPRNRSRGRGDETLASGIDQEKDASRLPEPGSVALENLVPRLERRQRELSSLILSREKEIRRLELEIETGRRAKDALENHVLEIEGRLAESERVAAERLTSFEIEQGAKVTFENRVLEIEGQLAETEKVAAERLTSFEIEQGAKVALENRVLEIEGQLAETEKVAADRLASLGQLKSEVESILGSKAYKLGSSILRLLHRKQPSGSH